MVRRADQHAVRRCPAHLRASHHEAEVGGLGMLATCLEAVIHRRCKAGPVTGQAGLDAAGHFFIHRDTYAARFLRVRAAFLADAERSAAGLRAAALPPRCPPLRAGEWSSGLPRPEPLFLPPWVRSEE